MRYQWGCKTCSRECHSPLWQCEFILNLVAPVFELKGPKARWGFHAASLLLALIEIIRRFPSSSYGSPLVSHHRALRDSAPQITRLMSRFSSRGHGRYSHQAIFEILPYPMSSDRPLCFGTNGAVPGLGTQRTVGDCFREVLVL